jgi:FkbM family methyltransferase
MNSHLTHINFNNYSFDFHIHDPKIDRIVSRKILKRGVWESELTKIWMDHISKNNLILDIGANIGWYSKIALLKEAEVFSFEPDPRNFKLLEINCKDANVINAAVGDSTNDLKIKFNEEGNFGDTQINVSGETLVKQITIDNLLENRAEEIKAIKIDVQGWEPYVISGGKNTFSKLSKGCLVLLEFSPYHLIQNNFDFHCLDNFFKMFSNSYAFIKNGKVNEKATMEQMFSWLESNKNNPKCYYGDTVNLV